MGELPYAIYHPTSALLQSYVEEGIPASTGTTWSRAALDEAIKNGPHASAYTPEMVGFIREEMQRMVHDGFRTLFPVEYGVLVFRENLKISRIVAVPQANLQLRLILNLLSQPDKVTPSINDTTDRDIEPESMQFGQAFPYILHAIWEADPEEGPVRVSKLNVTYAYHRGIL